MLLRGFRGLLGGKIDCFDTALEVCVLEVIRWGKYNRSSS